MASALQEEMNSNEETNSTNETTTTTTTTNETNETSLTLRDYGERSFVVLGNTRPFSSSLRSLGGKFNKFLTVDGSKVPGWVFSRKHRDAVSNFVTAANNGETPDLTGSVPVVTGGGSGLPTVDVPRATNYQTVHFKVFCPSVGMRVSLKSDGRTLREGKVVKTTSTGNVVDTVYIDFDGSTSMGVICWGRWVIFGYNLDGHSLFFH